MKCVAKMVQNSILHCCIRFLQLSTLSSLHFISSLFNHSKRTGHWFGNSISFKSSNKINEKVLLYYVNNGKLCHWVHSEAVGTTSVLISHTRNHHCMAVKALNSICAEKVDKILTFCEIPLHLGVKRVGKVISFESIQLLFDQWSHIEID